MPTLAAKTSGEGERGFTLIEFSFVALMLGVIFSLVYARWTPQVVTDPLQADSLRLVEVIRRIRLQAVVSGILVHLRLDLSQGKWMVKVAPGWGRSADAPSLNGELSRGVRLWKVHLADGNVISQGEANLRFLPTGETERARLFLSDSGREERTLLIHPFLDRVEILHGRVEDFGR